MKFINYCLFILFLFCAQQSRSQTGINFQGVARNNSGIILASQNISVRLSILQGSATGNLEFQETKTVATNAQGLFNVIIGDGTATTTLGNFNNINWQLNPRFVKIEMDANAGTNFTVLGTTQLQYVAYAYFANGVSAENIVGLVPVARGGTGASNLQILKQNLQIENVNNTSDLNKPISTATNTALASKLNIEDTSNMLSDYYNKTGVDAKLNLKAPLANPVFSTDINVNGVTVGTGKVNVNGNTLVGNHALSFLGIENFNTAIGNYALNADTNKVGNNNIGIGTQTLRYNNNGSKNVAIGNMALYSKQSGDGNTAIGYGADAIGPIDLTNTTAIGYNARVSESNMVQLGNTATIKVNTSGVVTAAGFKTHNGTASDILLANGTTLITSTLETNINKSTDNTLGGVSASNILYPTQKAVKDYVAANTSSGGVADGGITTIKLADGAVTDAKVAGVSSSKITGTIDIAHGGTGLNAAGRLNEILTSTNAGTLTWTSLTGISSQTITITSLADPFDLSSTGLNSSNLDIRTAENLSNGAGSLASNESGIANIGMGIRTLNSNTNGTANTAFGFETLFSNINGQNNTGMGTYALRSNTSGSYNSAFGSTSMLSNTTGYNNVAFGEWSFFSNTTGNSNTTAGANSLFLNTSGNSNTAVGADALYSNTTGSNNTSIGNGADVSSGTLNNATSIGYGAIVNSSNTIQLGNNDINSVETNGLINSNGINPSLNFNSSYFNNNNLKDGDLFYFNQVALDFFGFGVPYYPGYYFWDSNFNQFLPIWFNLFNNNVQYNAGLGININSNTISTIQDISNISTPIFNSLNLTNGDNYNVQNGLSQLKFGWNDNGNASLNGSVLYSHAIKTRHNSGSSLGNNIDFYTWDPSTNSNNSLDVGNKFIMTLQGDGKVGIGVSIPTQALDVNGNINTTGNLISGTATYPNTIGSNLNDQILTSHADGTITWSDYPQASNFTGLGSAAYSSTTDFESPLSFSSPLIRTGNNIILNQSNSTTAGYLSFTDWNTFNNKQNALTVGVDYLSPNGNASTATTAGNITATSNLTLTSLNNLSTVGTITSGTWSSTLANNLVGISTLSATNTPTAETFLSGDNTWKVPNGTGVPYTGANANVDLGIHNLTTSGVINASSITGNASTATLAGNITATTNTTLTSLPNLNVLGTISNGIWHGNVIDVIYGGTGTNTSTGSGSVVLSNSPTLISPNIGNAVASSLYVGNQSLNTSAILEANSTTKGFLPPRMTAAQRDGISTPLQGLIIYCTNCGLKGEINVYDGFSWSTFSGSNPTTPLTIGTNYGGGIITYFFEPGDIGYVAGQLHGLIVSTSDATLNGPSVWASAFPWEINNSMISTTSTSIGTGMSNTNMIISNQGTGNYAAYMARNFNANGYYDWYLPSKDELNIILANRIQAGVNFASNYYWSSSEAGNYVYWQYYNSSSSQWYKTGASGAVRPIRTF
jgi:hypothetical protein